MYKTKYIMNDFNAQEAKQIVSSISKNELHNILVDIKSAAEQGKTVSHIYKSLDNEILNELTNRGFRVVAYNGIAILRDSLYYSIYWN